MSDDFLESIRKGLRETVDFFGSRDKFQLERWVVENFLKNIDEAFQDSDIRRGGDPPDVEVRGAAFEVKEVIDKGRRRHGEYKEALAKAERAIEPNELLTTYSPKRLSLHEVYEHVLGVAKHHAQIHYPANVRKNFDLLVYVNLEDVMHFDVTPLPDVTELRALGYRSVSFLDGGGHISGVFCAEEGAPTFLAQNVGVIRRRPIPME